MNIPTTQTAPVTDVSEVSKTELAVTYEYGGKERTRLIPAVSFGTKQNPEKYLSQESGSIDTVPVTPDGDGIIVAESVDPYSMTGRAVTTLASLQITPGTLNDPQVRISVTLLICGFLVGGGSYAYIDYRIGGVIYLAMLVAALVIWWIGLKLRPSENPYTVYSESPEK